MRELAGTPAAPGLGTGPACPLGAAGSSAGAAGGARSVAAALAGVAEELTALAVRLRAEGRDEEAELVDTSALMAADPGLRAEAEQRVTAGAPAPDALLAAAETAAGAIAAIDDPVLSERAADVRSVGRRAATLAGGADGPAAQPGDVLVAEDLGPADVAELGGDLAGIALAAGASTAHAAIVARSLGVPMVVNLGPELLRVSGGEPLVVDGERGLAVLSPTSDRRAAAAAAMQARARGHARAGEDRHLPAQTRDGQAIRVLANVAGPAEVELALAAGAEGIGLLRTELAFLDAEDWPDEAAHRAALRPVLEAAGDRLVVVRLLDFGGDKLPPFLRGTDERGIRLLLSAPAALAAQLRAIAALAPGRRLRVLAPLVTRPAELDAVHEALASVPGGSRLPLGAMVETPEAAACASVLAARTNFLSIGTNDLAAAVHGVDRFGGDHAPASDPRVLQAIGQTVEAAAIAGLPLEVCGEAASDRETLPLLLGLGVREISVGAARVGDVRAWIRELDLRAPAAAG